MGALSFPELTRSWPAWLKYVLTGVGIGFVVAVQLLWPIFSGFPFLVYLPVVIFAAVLFDRGTSVFAALLAAACAAFFTLPPRFSFQIADGRSVVALLLFLVVSAGTGFLIELLHTAIVSVHRSNIALRISNERLAAAEREKDLLLREYVHRTKNDLATYISLVRIEAKKIEQPAIRERIGSLADRGLVFARLQDRLSIGKQEPVVNVGEYIADLCEEMNATLIGVRPISIRVTAEEHLLPASEATAVGLIANELLTNAMKHAFPDSRGGTVRVVFKKETNDFLLCVDDDGVGMKSEAQLNTTDPGRGGTIVRQMVRKLGGTLRVRVRNDGEGTVANVHFPPPAMGAMPGSGGY